MSNIETTFSKEKFQQLSELGSKFNLSFSSQMAIGNKLIALDGIKKSLLVLESINKSCIIELNKIASVSVKKTYNSIRPGELKKRGIEEFLNTIELQFEYRNKNGTVSIPFYDCEEDDLHNLPTLERNAKNWQMILSKMIYVPAKKKIKELKS
ncbi:MAG: hypothetical protein ACJ751_13935 [Niastella sp.]|uniref:hypothetical protein n=1 Tax=Niastella sp. TaxID=1869183 RepID=UPI00389AE43E